MIPRHRPWLRRLALVGLLAVSPLAIADAGPTMKAARAATDARDWGTALPLYGRLLADDPANADLLIEAARVHGFADRNADAALLYERALAAAPGRRADILPSLAWQTLWSGRPAQALPWFEELSVSGPDRADALDGLGQTRQALGDLAGALQAWQAATRWRSDDAALRFRIARAWRWAGFEDRAAPLLAGLSDPEAAWLRDWRVARELSRYAFGSVEHARDRDDLESTALTLGAGWRPAPGAMAEFSVRQLSLRDAQGDPSGPQVQGVLRWRLGEPAAPGGTFWPAVTLRAARYGDWTATTGAARVAWVPRDGWRIDGELGREAIETPLAIANRVTADTASIGVDHRPTSRVRLVGSLAALHFDDGNLRWRGQARADLALTTEPRWVVGLEGQTFTSSRPTDAAHPARGYWNPRRYAEWRAYTAITLERRSWDLQARIGLGRARETDGDGRVSTGSPNLWELGVGYDVSPGLRLGLAAGGAGSGFGLANGGAGYWRRYVNLSVTGWF